MKFSEVKGDRAYEILPDIIEAVAPIADDPDAAALFKPITASEGVTWQQAMRSWLADASTRLIKPHKKQLARIFAAIRGVSAVEYMETANVDMVLGDTFDLVTDAAFRDLFFLPEQSIETSSGSATENTEDAVK